MKATIVPAQITSVEDKIAGNLTLTQLLLLIAPVFVGGGAYGILPPTFDIAAYKIVLIIIFAAISGTLAIRIKGKILLLWLVVVLNYCLRPRYYIFNKNDSYLRESATEKAPKEETMATQATDVKEEQPHTRSLDIADAARLQHLIADPQAKLHFKTDKKGVLRVHITEIK
jgi:hypothetical protein